MTPVMQTVFTSLDRTTKGNCFRACLASILEIGIDDIPNLEGDGQDWFYIFNRFLKENELKYEGILGTKDQPPTQQELDEYEGIDGYYIVGGESPRKHVTAGHGVVYHRGKMIHNPYPNCSVGLVQPWYIYMIERNTLAEGQKQEKNEQ